MSGQPMSVCRHANRRASPITFSLSIFHKKAMLAHRPVAPLDHRAFRVTLMMMRERPDAGGCCAGPMWDEAGQHPAVPGRGGSAADVIALDRLTAGAYILTC